MTMNSMHHECPVRVSSAALTSRQELALGIGMWGLGSEPKAWGPREGRSEFSLSWGSLSNPVPSPRSLPTAPPVAGGPAAL